MRISAYIHSLDMGGNLPIVDTLLTEAQAGFSFWGERRVKVEGYSGYISVDALAAKVLKAAEKHSKDADFTLQQRVAGINIRNKLIQVYREGDALLRPHRDQPNRRLNWLTRLFVKIREFSLYPYTTRFHTETGFMRDYFLGFSEQEYFTAFGRKAEEGDPNEGFFGPPPRILVTEKVIRERASQLDQSEAHSPSN